jgi:hypothetical protein
VAFLSGAGLDLWPPGMASLKITGTRLAHVASAAVLVLVAGDAG